jgi:hypothetical protein
LAFASSQLPLAGAAGEIDEPHFGRSASFWATSSPASCATSVTTFGSNPFSASTSRAILTISASGGSRGCGFTTTALPVARSAKKPGKPFHVGNVLQRYDEGDAAGNDPETLFHP